MGNIGRPSAGCYTCRRRRIKCDEARPGCMKCKVYGQACPGYRKESDVLFVNENRTAMRLATGDEFATDSDTESCKDISRTSAELYSRGSPEFFATPINALSSRGSTESLCLFMSTFVAKPSPSGLPGHLGFLPRMLQEPNHPSCLDMAVDAEASANYATRIFHEKNPLSAREKYARAIRATNMALLDPTKQLADGTLMAVWMLGLYEIIVGRPETDQSKGVDRMAWQAHVAGMAEILKLRGPEQFKTRRGQSIFRLVHVQIKVSSLVAGKEPPPESVSWMMDLFQSSKSTNKFIEQATRSSLYVYHASRLCKKMRDALTERVPDYCRLTALLKEAVLLDHECEDWSWDYDEFVAVHLSSAELGLTDFDLAGSTGCVDVYKSFYSMVMWNLFRSGRIILHTYAIQCQTLLQIHIVSQGGTLESDSINTNIEIIREMATDIIHSIAYALGDIDSNGKVQARTEAHLAQAYGGLAVMFAIRTIRTNQFVTEDQKRVINLGKKRIGHQLGIHGLNY